MDSLGGFEVFGLEALIQEMGEELLEWRFWI